MQRSVALTLLFAGLAAGCESPSSPHPWAVDAIRITGQTTFTALNQTSQLSATVTFATGQQSVVSDLATWTSSNAAVATVSSTGLLKTIDYGTATITATFQAIEGNVSGTASVQVNLVPLSLQIENAQNLTDVGQTLQLKAIVQLQDGSSKDVTSQAIWSSDHLDVMTTAVGGVVTATGLGVGTISARYSSGGKTVSRGVTLVVTPAGTIAVTGRTRDPGTGGLNQVTIVHQPSGITKTSSSGGLFTMGGIAGGTLVFSKAGYETASVDVLSLEGSAYKDADVPLQPIIRVNAGDAVDKTIAPHDMDYPVAAGPHCYPCLLVRVGPSPTGKVLLELTWTEKSSSMSLWINGVRYQGDVAGPTTVSADLAPGNAELMVYVGQPFNDSATYVSFRLKTVIR